MKFVKCKSIFVVFMLVFSSSGLATEEFLVMIKKEKGIIGFPDIILCNISTGSFKRKIPFYISSDSNNIEDAQHYSAIVKYDLDKFSPSESWPWQIVIQQNQINWISLPTDTTTSDCARGTLMSELQSRNQLKYFVLE